MKKHEMMETLNVKLNEINAKLVAFKKCQALDGSPVSPNTARTQSHLLSREQKTLNMLLDIVSSNDDLQMGATSEAWFKNLCTLTGERTAGKELEVRDGENIVAVMQRHAKVTNLMAKLGRQGFVVGADGIVHQK